MYTDDLRAVVDTGAAPVIVRLGALPEGVDIFPLTDAPLLVDAQRKALSLLGVVKGRVLLGDHSYRITALVAENLSVDLILGTQFIDANVRLINPRHRCLTMDNGEAVPLAESSYRRIQRVIVKERITIPPRHEAVVPVWSEAEGLSLITTMGLRRVAVTNGIHLLEKNTTFLTKVANFSQHAVTLVPGTVIARAVAHSDSLLMNVEEDDGKPEPDWRESIDLSGLIEEQKIVVRDLLEEFSHLWDEKRLGVIHGTTHRIETSGNPVFQHPYRAGPEARRVEQEEVDRMLKMGVIEPSNAEWASPVVLIPKPDGSTRFCVDYRKVNALTARDVYPLPRMDECLDSLGEASYFTTLDANTGFWQIEVHPDDRDKTTFSCHAGMYRFLRMPFGLINAPATFQRAMDILLSDVRWESVIVYLDDIIIFSKSFEEHVRHLRVVLQKLTDSGATLKFSKCKFFRQSVDYLGHHLLPHKLQVLKKNVEAIEKAEAPTTKTQVRSFLGLCGVYRRFVPGYATVAKPLTSLTKKGFPENFELSEDQQAAFENLRQALVSAPTLSLPRDGRQYVIDTDASDQQIGCVLQQPDDEGELHPLGYWSRQLNAAEVNYSTTEKEALAIVWAVTHLRPYLERKSFILRTDHSSLQWLMSISGDNPRLVRWRLRLAEFSFQIQYKPGRVNQAADALSRMPTDGCDVDELDLEIPVLTLGNTKKVFQSISVPRAGPTLEDVTLEPLEIAELIDAQASDENCCAMVAKSSATEDERGLLVRTSPLDGSRQVVIPETLQGRCLALFHLPKVAGHTGSTKMYAQMRRVVYWPRMAADVSYYVSRCPSCAKKSLRVGRKTTKLSLFPPSAPMEFVAMDILGPLTTTDRGNRFLLVVTDRFSKLTRAFPLSITTADVVAHAFFDGWVASGYGIPSVLLTDNGPQFISKFFQTFCRTLGVKQVYTSAYRPSTNGQTERFNRTVAEYMGAYVSEHQHDWDILAGVATYSYNVKPQSTTGFTPFELVTAVPQASLLPQIEVSPVRKEKTKAQLRDEFLESVADKCTMAKETLSAQQLRYKQAYDSHVRELTASLNCGDLVYVKTYVAQKDISKKLIFPAAGPFIVTKMSPDRRTLKVRTSEGEATVAADRVRKCTAPQDLPSGMKFANSPPEATNSGTDDSLEGEDVDDLTEFVIDRVIAHRVGADGQRWLRIRWFGYDSSQDSWEPVVNIPPELVRRYVRRRRLNPADYGLHEC